MIMAQTETTQTNQLWNMGNTYQVQARPTRIEFPKFNGDNFDGWIFRSNPFFKVKIAVSL